MDNVLSIAKVKTRQPLSDLPTDRSSSLAAENTRNNSMHAEVVKKKSHHTYTHCSTKLSDKQNLGLQVKRKKVNKNNGGLPRHSNSQGEPQLSGESEHPPDEKRCRIQCNLPLALATSSDDSSAFFSKKIKLAKSSSRAKADVNIRQRQSVTSVLHLPKEVMLNCFAMLLGDDKTWPHLSAVCKQWNFLMNYSQSLYQNIPRKKHLIANGKISPCTRINWKLYCNIGFRCNGTQGEHFIYYLFSSKSFFL